jgi:hypothetical protein
MRARFTSSLIALTMLAAACERGEPADGLQPLALESAAEQGSGVDADDEEVGRIVQRGALSLQVARTDAIDLAFERHAYLLEVDGEAVITIEAEGLTGDLRPALTVHAPLLAGFNPEALAVGESAEAGAPARIDEIVLPEAGVYLVVVGSDDEHGRGMYRLRARCDAGACVADSALLDECLPPVADRIFDCADRLMDAVDTDPEDGVITALDALHLCTRPHELAPAHADVCADTFHPACEVPFEPFVEAQSVACFDALVQDFEAPLDLTEIPVPTEIAVALDDAVKARCADSGCDVELRAFAYGDQFPTLREATVVTAAMSEPDLGGSYTHRSAWALQQRLVALEVEDVFTELRARLDLGDDPVVGRLFGSMEVAPHTDLLVETHAALFRSERVVVTLRATEHAS